MDHTSKYPSNLNTTVHKKQLKLQLLLLAMQRFDGPRELLDCISLELVSLERGNGVQEHFHTVALTCATTGLV